MDYFEKCGATLRVAGFWISLVVLLFGGYKTSSIFALSHSCKKIGRASPPETPHARAYSAAEGREAPNFALYTNKSKILVAFCRTNMV